MIYISFALHGRSSSIVVHACDSGVVGKTVIVEVDLSRSLLQDGDDSIEWAETILVSWTTGVGAVEGNNGIVTAEC